MAITRARVQIDGQWYALAYNADERVWEITITAPRSSYFRPGGVYPLTVEASNYSDMTRWAYGFDNPFLNLKVVDRVRPEITVVYPPGEYATDGAAPLVLDLTDDDSGINIDTFSMSVDGTPATAAITATETGYRVTWEHAALSEGPHIIRAEVTDYDGNAAALDFPFIVDTVPPALDILTEHLIVDAAEIEIKGYANDDTTPPVTVTVALEGKAIGTPAVDAYHHRFSITVPLSVGDNHVAVTARDRAGLETVAEILVMRLVTDRAQADVDRITALRETGWARMSAGDRAWYSAAVCRGRYQADDMNRVKRAMDYMQRRLIERGYLAAYSPQTIRHQLPIFADAPDENGEYAVTGHREWEDETWIPEDIPNRFDPRETAKFLSNVAAFRWILPSDEIPPPAPESMDDLTHQEANDIEKILVLADSGFTNLNLSIFFAGEIFAGEV